MKRKSILSIIILLILAAVSAQSGGSHFGIISAVKDRVEEVKEEKGREQKDTAPTDNLPTISITSPADGATVSGTVIVAAAASDDKGIAKVEFYIDGILKETDNTLPFSYSWDTAQYSSGTHAVKAIVYDTALQTAIAQISVAIPKWELMWSDEFEGTEVDPNKWTFEIGNGQGGWGTGQIDYATSRPENAMVKDGELALTVRKENYAGFQYTSSRMITKGKANFLYGRIEIKAKAIYSQGIGLAFWMLGANYEDPDWWWPKCGEIDILEITGRDPGLNIGTAHFEESWGHNYSQGSLRLPEGQRFADDYHIFALEWDENNIMWYVDSVKINDFDISKPINGRRPFNNEFFLILSTGVGGNYSGNPDSTSIFPMTAYADWVRVYKKH